MAKRRLAFVLLAVLAAAGFLGAEALGPSGGVAGAQTSSCEPLEVFDVANFPDSPSVDNRFLPLIPGTRLVFEGRASSTGEPLPHRVEFTVTDLTKVIDGVRSTVVWDVDSSEGQLIETELAFFAQDTNHNVWSLGEYPEEYEGGEFVGAPSTWIHGQGDAEGGIHMPGDPLVGMPEYLQGSVPSIEFLDCAQIVETGGSVCPPAGCFNDVLLTHERSPLDPGGGIQTKAHAPGVGIVEIGAIDDPEAETLVLVEIQHLDAAGLDAARSAAFELEGRAYQESAVYAATPPMERLGGEPPPVTTVPPPVEPPTTQAPPPTQAPPTTAVTVPPTSTPARSNAAARTTVSRGLALTGSDTISLAMVGTLSFAIGVALVVVTRLTAGRSAAHRGR